MTTQEILAEAERHFAAIRAAAVRKEIDWMKTDLPEGGIGYNGVIPGYFIVLTKGKDTSPDGAVTTTGTFSVIHLTPEMALFCYECAILTEADH